MKITQFHNQDWTPDCSVSDIEVGMKFFYATSGGEPVVYTKLEEVGSTGCNWCYCKCDLDGFNHRIQFDQQIKVIE